jgi:hypothetical protein
VGRLVPISCVLVGLALAAGFGAIGVDSLLDRRAFPGAPIPITVAQLAAMKVVPRGTWVKLVDAHPDCVQGYAKPSDTSYVLVGDGKTASRVIAALNEPPSCAELGRREFTGVPSLRRTASTVDGKDLPHELAWRGVDWQRWPEQRAVILWTWSGPDDSWMGIWLGAGFGVLGLLVTWYGVSWLKPRTSDAVVIDESVFPTTFRLARHAMPATVVWLPVLRSYEVTARGLGTGVTIYELKLPPNVAPLETQSQRVLTADSSPHKAGLIFGSDDRTTVAAVRPSGSKEHVILRSNLAEVALDAPNRTALRARHLRGLAR